MRPPSPESGLEPGQLLSREGCFRARSGFRTTGGCRAHAGKACLETLFGTSSVRHSAANLRPYLDTNAELARAPGR